MVNERPLYQDSEIKIEMHPRSHEDHLLYLCSWGEEELNFIIPRGCLRELATTPRDRLELKMRNLNSDMVEIAFSRGLTPDSLGLAIAQAYIEDERRIQNIASSLKL
jgi:hypothetical protein